jgi:hypothetical protein
MILDFPVNPIYRRLAQEVTVDESLEVAKKLADSFMKYKREAV